MDKYLTKNSVPTKTSVAENNKTTLTKRQDKRKHVDESDEQETAQIGPRKKINKFNESWLLEDEFKGWLTKDYVKKDGHDLAKCLICSHSIIAHKSDIIRHMNSDKHIKKSREVNKTLKVTDFMCTNLQTSVRRGELKLSGLLAEKNIPLSFMDELIEVNKDIYSDSAIAKKMNLHRTKTTSIIKQVLGVSFMEEISNHLRIEGNFFSIIMDETTDQTAKKQCCFNVIVYDKTTCTVDTKFFDMVEVVSSTAVGLYECLKKVLINRKIPFDNLVGFSSDTTNVMAGAYHSVYTLLKKDNPHISIIKCSCHMINLSSSKACLQLPPSVEDLLRSVGAHFSRSSHRQHLFQEFQEFFQVEIHKILTLSQTRWLSLKACVDRVLEQYTPLKMYFLESAFSDPCQSTERMSNTMNNDFTIIYLEFMSYVLSLLCDFNVMFQSESPLLFTLKPEVEKLLKIIYSNFMKVDYVRSITNMLDVDIDTDNFVPLEKIYTGIAASESIYNLNESNEVSHAEIRIFYKNCQNFYVELAKDISKRFDFSDKLFDFISIVDPKVAQKFEFNSLLPAFHRFPVLNKFVKCQEVDDEWRAHAMLNFDNFGLNADESPETYWKKVFLLKNSAVERKFSVLRNMKTKNRNKLETDTVVALMATQEGIAKQGGSVKFNPSEKMLRKPIW